MKYQNKKNALSQYKAYSYNYKYYGQKPQAKDLMGIFESICQELLIYSCSEILTAAFHACSAKYPRLKLLSGTEWLSKTIDTPFMSQYDGECWILFLKEYIVTQKIRESDLEGWLHFIFENYQSKQNLYQSITDSLSVIQEWIIRKRAELVYQRTQSGACNAQQNACSENESQILADARAQASKIQADAAKEAETILSDARNQQAILLKNIQTKCDEKERTLVDKLNQDVAAKRVELMTKLDRDLTLEKKKILDTAQKKAEMILAEAQHRATRLTTDILDERYKTEQQPVTNGLDALRTALLEINSQMRAMEKTLTESNTQKASRQLLELYDIIADLKDSAAAQMEDDLTGIHGNTMHNMQMLLMLVQDALSEYGITTISTLPGEPFNGKIHEVKNNHAFDPKTAIVAQSLREGFSWDQQVIQKEWIKLAEKECDNNVFGN